ncbi:hypothetical protein DL93DRAFT_2226749 [Clavulina sp. PMI_390]|nr:hypothetical protein DL93DRAFT_2226749 [Clavulina sp. PMI_390]
MYAHELGLFIPRHNIAMLPHLSNERYFAADLEANNDIELHAVVASDVTGMFSYLPQNSPSHVPPSQGFSERGLEAILPPIPPAHMKRHSSHHTHALSSTLPEDPFHARNTDGTTRVQGLALSLSSKTARIQSDITHLPNGFITGTMSDESFCQWALSSPASLRNAAVADVTCWSRNRFPFYHHFVVVTIKYTPDNTAPSMYNIVIERVGKGAYPFQEAKHQVTIQPATTLGQYCPKNYLIIGLFETPLEQRKHDPIRWSWISDLKRNNKDYYAPYFWDRPAFSTQLDEKWRGPPATLAHLAKIIQHIVTAAPHYNLGSTNCYFFSRLLVHAIALRHYSFSSVANISDGRPFDDQSSTLRIFLRLEQMEYDDSMWLYTVVTWTSIVIGGIGGLSSLLALRLRHGFVAMFMFMAVMLGGIVYLFWGLRIRRRLHTQTEDLARALDEDITMTHPQGRRGLYSPYQEMAFHDQLREENVTSWPRAELQFENLPRYYDGHPVRLQLQELTPPPDTSPHLLAERDISN